MNREKISAAIASLFDDQSTERDRGAAVATLAVAHFDTQERIAKALEKIARDGFTVHCPPMPPTDAEHDELVEKYEGLSG